MRAASVASTSFFPAHRPGKAGFTLLEMLVVVTIIAIVVGMTVGVSGSLRGSRGSTAIQQLAAVVDEARAKALTGDGEVVLAFATDVVAEPETAYRAVMICRSPVAGAPTAKYEPLSGWYFLPDGYVFALSNPADHDAGVNVLNAPDAQLRVLLPGGNREATLPCIGFRELGAVSLPQDTRGRPVLVAIAEGTVEGTRPQSPAGDAHSPAQCRWLAVQKNSGNSLILP